MIFKQRVSRERGIMEGDKLIELHLYPGNLCNRECSFCTVLGNPKGWYRKYTSDHLEGVLQTVCTHEGATLKFYGGEPTLDFENVIWAIGYLRERGFRGSFVIYSNGIQATLLIQIMESDPLKRTTASLNYSITTGDGAPPMPRKSLRLLEEYEAKHPGTIAMGHPTILDIGRGFESFQGDSTRPRQSSQCPRCYPVLTTQGQFHACPFAVEIDAPHFQLGPLNSPPERIARNFKIFLNWLDTIHEPYAVKNNLPACTVCQRHLKDLPVPLYLSEKA
jgi:hypothetical protein